MNEVNIMLLQTPIEAALGVDEKGMTTARKLYEFLEMDETHYSRWCKANITGNEFAEENVDYFYSPSMASEQKRGNFAQDFKLTAHFAKKLSCKGSGKKAELAREYFTTLEERVKEMAINRSELSPQMQMFYAIADGQAKIELEQKRQAEKIERVEKTVNNMKEVMATPIGDWKAEINAKVREIAIKSGIDFQSLYAQMYGELENTAHCSLKRLQDNKKARMVKAGNTNTAIKDGTTKIAVIFEKPQLKAIFEGIVKRYAMAYCV